jgi:integrase
MELQIKRSNFRGNSQVHKIRRSIAATLNFRTTEPTEHLMSLTDRALKNAKPKPTVYRIRDASADPELKGLGVTIAPAGSKTFFLGFTSPATGKRRQINLGRYPATTLKDARQKARVARAVIAQGGDPADECDDVVAITLGEGLGMYARARLDHQRTGRTTERDLRRDFGPLLDRPVNTVTAPMIASLIDEKAETAPTMANRLVGYSGPWFRWMKTRGHVSTNPTEDIEKPAKERSRERTLSQDEVAAIWDAAPKLGYPFGPFVRLLMLTGVRREELAGMRHDEIDFDAGLWTVPAARSKTGVSIRIPLSRATVEVLQGVANTGSAFVFTTTGKAPVSGFSKMKKRLDGLSGITDWRLHDARRTMVSAMVDLGIDATTADRCLNHTGAATMSTVQRVYQRSDLLDQRRRAMDAWGERIEAITKSGNKA